MQTSALIAKLHAQRESWVELDGAKRVKIRRPAESKIPAYFQKAEGGTFIRIPPDEVPSHVVDWEGFTEADILGAAVGASDPVPFDPALWAAMVDDRIEWIGKVSHALVEAVAAHVNGKAIAGKN